MTQCGVMKAILNRLLMVLCLTASSMHAEDKVAPAELLENLQTVVAARKPYLSEYQLLGPRGELHATIGKGENRQFVLRMIIKDRKETMFEFWCADGKRIFIRSGGTTQCIQDGFALTDALSELNAIFSGDAALPMAMEASLYLEKEILAVGLLMKSSPLLNALKEDDSCTIKKNDQGNMEVTSKSLGALIIDPSDANIIEQTNGPRSMKRIRHEKKNAATLVADLVKTFDPIPFQIIPLDKAKPTLRVLASLICQEELNAVDQGKSTAKQLKETLDKHADDLATKVMPGLLNGKEGVFRRDFIDTLRDESLELLREELQKKGLPAASIDEVAKSDEVLKMLEEKLNRDLQKAFNDMKDKASQKILLDVLHGDLTATTADGKKAQSIITDAMIQAYIASSVHDSITRFQKSRNLD